MAGSDRSRIAVLPGGVRGYLASAVEAGGGVVSEPGDAVALVWTEVADATSNSTTRSWAPTSWCWPCRSCRAPPDSSTGGGWGCWPGGCLVNVARGQLVVTSDLVDALRDGTLGSAGLDVTDPEPLPEGHPLWSLPNAIVTPHTANTQEMAVLLLSARITHNVGRWLGGERLVGLVDPIAGY